MANCPSKPYSDALSTANVLNYREVEVILLHCLTDVDHLNCIRVTVEIDNQ